MFTIQTKSCKRALFTQKTAFIIIIIIIIIFIIIIISVPINTIIKLIIITIIIFFHILEKKSPEKAISFFLTSSFLHYPFCFGQKNGTYLSPTIYVWIILYTHLWNTNLKFIYYSFSEEHLRANISDPDYGCEFVQIL